MKRPLIILIVVSFVGLIIATNSTNDKPELRTQEQLVNAFKQKAFKLSFENDKYEDPIPFAKDIELYFEKEKEIVELKPHFDSLSTLSQQIWQQIFITYYSKEEKEKLLSLTK